MKVIINSIFLILGFAKIILLCVSYDSISLYDLLFMPLLAGMIYFSGINLLHYETNNNRS